MPCAAPLSNAQNRGIIVQDFKDKFASPAKMLDWAQTDLLEIDKLWQKYGAEHPPKYLNELHPIDKITRLYVETEAPLPERITQLVHSASTSIRHGFDQAFHLLVSHRNGKAPKNAHFPWRASYPDLKRYLEKFEVDGEPFDFIAETIRPYWTEDGREGDDLARDFAADINDSKHVMIASIDAQVESKDLEIKFKKAGNAIVHIMQPSTKVRDGKYMILTVDKNSAPISIAVHNVFYLAFGNGRLSRKPLAPTLRHCLAKAKTTLEKFEDYCR